MNNHLLWLWLWFGLGMVTYWLKRAYYLVTGPNPIAGSYKEFIQRCWIPLIVRGFIDSMVYWVLFIPGGGEKILGYFGWTSYSWAVGVMTQFAPVAGLFGHTVDSIMDFAVSKIPFVKDWLPQMPAPLKALPPGGVQP